MTTRWTGCASTTSPTLAELGGDRFEQMRSEALEVLDTDARIPYVRRRGEYLYNFWRDAANPRGLWRRTTLQSYRGEEPEWDVIIDVDELARRDDDELGVGGRRRHRAGSLAGVDQPVARRIGRRDRARIRHAHTRVRCRRIRVTRGEDADQLGRREHRAARHRLRGGFAHRVRVSAAGQAMASRAAA